MIILILLAIFSSFQLSADQVLNKRAEAALNSVSYTLSSPSIIGKREWKELRLDRVVDILDRTKTSFGRWGLVQLLYPIADMHQLLERKQIITFLVDNPDKMSIFQEQLNQVKRLEKSLLAYWDAQDQLNQSANQFYFSVFGLKELNKSSLALNASTLMEMFNSWKFILGALAFGGLSAEWNRWRYDKNKKSFDWKRGLQEGLATPIRQHSPYLHILEGANPPYTYKDYINVFVGTDASPADRYKLGYEGYTDVVSQTVDPGFGKVGALLGAVVPTLLFDYQFVTSVYSVGQRIVTMNRALNELQQRVADVAQCIQAIMNLRKLIARQSPEFNSYFNMDNTDDLQDFLNKLLSQRFLQKAGYFYSRGHVLTMHLEIKKAKKLLIPLLQSVALLDAYCSIAQLYKESQQEPVIFSFPEFVESSKPFLNYRGAWLPLLPSKEAVVNDLTLGGDTPGKIVITGPNGGGKSTILKTYGVAAVLAQSWCIVPAQHAQQTLLASIRTSLSSKEDQEKGLSFFMAEEKIMAEILGNIKRSGKGHYILALIDEPYKGTVDVESAKRIYQFGKDIAGFSQALVAIATHVKKPIKLEADTGGIFGNYQVKINEISPGVFERLFKIVKGPAMWWFEDDEKRSRFIDWVKVKPVLP